MIVLFTDFGVHGPYVGQMKAVLQRAAPQVPVIDLMHDAPVFDPQAAAYLFAALADEFPAGTVFIGVVDPGVGGVREPIILQADGRWLVGPDNGLFAIVARRASEVTCRNITWQPERISASFHGRDVFAPVAARIACGKSVPGEERHMAQLTGHAWPDDLPRVIYIDNFGNAMTGIRAGTVLATARLKIGAHILRRARTFSDVGEGRAFCYENANGLIEIAANRQRADQLLGIQLGDAVEVWSPDSVQ